MRARSFLWLAVLLLALAMGAMPANTVAKDGAAVAWLGVETDDTLRPGDVVYVTVRADQPGDAYVTFAHGEGETAWTLQQRVTPAAYDGVLRTPVLVPILPPGPCTMSMSFSANAGVTLVQSAVGVVIEEVPNTLPHARFTLSASYGQPGVPLTFNAATSVAPTDTPVEFAWEFGDGNHASGPRCTHTYAQPGLYEAALTVSTQAGVHHVSRRQVWITEGTETRTRVDPQWLSDVEAGKAVLDLAARYPDLARAEAVGVTVQGRPIWGLTISDHVHLAEPEPRVLFDGAIHANELITTEVVLDIATQLLGGYGWNERATRWVDTLEVHLIPVFNADGRHIVFNESSRRRSNANRVDLNRNFPFLWTIEPNRHFSDNPRSGSYRGPFPGSEPETQAVMAWTLRNQAVTGLTYHSAAEMISPPYDSVLTGEEDLINGLSERIAQACVSEGRRGGPYESVPGQFYGEQLGGVSCDWQYFATGVVSILVEVGSSWYGQDPPYRQRDTQVQGVRGSWTTMLDRAAGPGILVEAKSADGNPLPNVTVRFREVERPQDERWTTDRLGRFRHCLLPGSYTVECSLPGYTFRQPRPVTVTANSRWTTVRLMGTRQEDTTGKRLGGLIVSRSWCRVGEPISIALLPGTAGLSADASVTLDLGDNSRIQARSTVTHFRSPGTRLIRAIITGADGTQERRWRVVHVLPALEQE